ncbi:alcohol dehydrogenase catalytic domain-containing protein [Spirosoma sp. HMF4905]|uniref:Alcohol dehydrogenase catalytic domain-containing protein n=1 Tax=Spirosoma arboris TaxID=2682092 RepID=A0A7K1SJC5_9BACT|nr:NAD(P)-dependent alcohol dehydrogenase [Spirosoma arboris]MVM33863.1 alcohol dehydrogenase catalytic domain-containing protein [Spirosoma arboris]
MIATKGYAAQRVNAELAPWNFERRELDAHDVQIEILFCGVCHTDIHFTRDTWFPGIYPMVPGHEIVGIIKAVGPQAHKFTIGDYAGVGTMVDSCRECADCKSGHENFCEQQVVYTYNGVGKDGQVTYGGYADNIVVHEDFAFRISDQLDLAATAPLLCAGITMYSPLRKWKVGNGHKLAIVGLGGLGHMGVKFGLALGAEVTVISTSASKEASANQLGAHHFIVSKDEAQMKSVFHSFDFIIDTVSADHDIHPYIGLLKTNGTYINVGLPAKPWEISSFSVVVGNKAITGSGSGGLQETQDMLDFCAEHNIVSDIELIDIKNINEAFERMEKGDVRYRFVIDMATL